jgi:hypothetical protein
VFVCVILTSQDKIVLLRYRTTRTRAKPYSPFEAFYGRPYELSINGGGRFEDETWEDWYKRELQLFRDLETKMVESNARRQLNAINSIANNLLRQGLETEIAIGSIVKVHLT